MSFKVSKKYKRNLSFVKACKNDSRTISEKEKGMKVYKPGLIFLLFYYTCYKNCLDLTFFATLLYL